MYKKECNHQFSLNDFNQSIGLKRNPKNHWVKKADLIPWKEIEERYTELFSSNTGMPAKPLRIVRGSLLIQKQYDYSDRELVEQIKENRITSASLAFMGTSRKHRMYLPVG